VKSRGEKYYENPCQQTRSPCKDKHDDAREEEEEEAF
jgi:hypothetical protein